MAERALNGLQQANTNVAVNDDTNSNVLPKNLDQKLRSVLSTLELAKEQISSSKFLLSTLKCISGHLQDFVNEAEAVCKTTEKCIEESRKQMEDLKSEIMIYALAESSTKKSRINSRSSTEVNNDEFNLEEDNCNKDNYNTYPQYSKISESKSDDSHVSPQSQEVIKNLPNSQEEVNRTLDCNLGLLPETSALSYLPKIPRVKIYDFCNDVEHNQQTSVKAIDDDLYDIEARVEHKSTNRKISSSKHHLEIDVENKHSSNVTFDWPPENIDCSNVTFDTRPNLENHSLCSKKCSLIPTYSTPDVPNCIPNCPVSNTIKCSNLQDNLLQLESIPNTFLSHRLKRLQKSLQYLSIKEDSPKSAESSKNEDAQLLVEEVEHNNTADFVVETDGHICEDCMANEDKVNMASGRYISFHEELNEALSEYIMKLDRKGSEEYSYQKLQNVSSLTNDRSLNNSQIESPSYVTISEATTTDTSINDVSDAKKDTSISDRWFQSQDCSVDSEIIVPDSDQDKSPFISSDDPCWVDVSSDSGDERSSESGRKISDTESCSPSSQLPNSSSSSSGSFSRVLTSESDDSACSNCRGNYLLQQNVSYDSFREGIYDASLNNSNSNSMDKLNEDSEESSNPYNQFKILNTFDDTSLLGLDQKPLISSPYSYTNIRKSVNGTLLTPIIEDQSNSNRQNVDVSPVDPNGGEGVNEIAETDSSSSVEEMIPDLVQDIRIPRITVTEFITYQDNNGNVAGERLEAYNDNKV